MQNTLGVARCRKMPEYATRCSACIEWIQEEWGERARSQPSGPLRGIHMPRCTRPDKQPGCREDRHDIPNLYNLTDISLTKSILLAWCAQQCRAHQSVGLRPDGQVGGRRAVELGLLLLLLMSPPPHLP